MENKEEFDIDLFCDKLLRYGSIAMASVVGFCIVTLVIYNISLHVR